VVTSDSMLWELERRGLRPAAGRRFALTVDGRMHQVQVPTPDGLTYRVVVDGEPVTLQLAPLGKETPDAAAANSILFRINVGGRWLRVEVVQHPSRKPELRVDGKPVAFAVGAPGATVAASRPPPGPARSPQRGVAAAPAGSDKRVTAVMPGRIVAVTITPGQRVEEGQELCVLEAMKMEQVIRAAAAGVIKQTFIRPGQTVNAGALLVELE